MEQTVYQELIAIQKKAEELRKGKPKPYWLHEQTDEYEQLMDRYETLMESEEVKAGLHEGSRTFEVFQSQGEPTVIKQVTADSFEEAFFKWLILSGYDNPYGQEGLPNQHGDTVEYEGIQATFYEQHREDYQEA